MTQHTSAGVGIPPGGESLFAHICPRGRYFAPCQAGAVLLLTCANHRKRRVGLSSRGWKKRRQQGSSPGPASTRRHRRVVGQSGSSGRWRQTPRHLLERREQSQSRARRCRAARAEHWAQSKGASSSRSGPGRCLLAAATWVARVSVTTHGFGKHSLASAAAAGEATLRRATRHPARAGKVKRSTMSAFECRTYDAREPSRPGQAAVPRTMNVGLPRPSDTRLARGGVSASARARRGVREAPRERPGNRGSAPRRLISVGSASVACTPRRYRPSAAPTSRAFSTCAG